MQQASAQKSVENLYTPRVRDLMTEDVFSLYPEDNLQFLDDAMKWKRIRHIPVISQEGEVLGILTHRDFLKVAVSELAQISVEDRQRLYKKITAEEIMNRNVACVSPDTSLIEASKLMVENKYGCLPVTLHGKLVGIITEADFVKSFTTWDVAFSS